MKTLIHPGDRVIARTNQQGLKRGRTYQVIEARTEVPECVRCAIEVSAYRLSTWPERNPQELTVRCGILHLKVATGYSLL